MPSQKKHFEVLARYYGARCVYCGRKDRQLTVDHIVPVSRGGSNGLMNKVLACAVCNGNKGCMFLDDFFMRGKGIGLRFKIAA